MLGLIGLTGLGSSMAWTFGVGNVPEGHQRHVPCGLGSERCVAGMREASLNLRVVPYKMGVTDPSCR